MAKQKETPATSEPKSKVAQAQANKSTIEILQELETELLNGGWRQKKAAWFIKSAYKILPTNPNDIN